MVEVEGLSKSFGYRRVLSGLSFKIAAGEHLVILGRNGCGKTTLINILATLVKPSYGKVIINGLDISKNDIGIRRSIGVVNHATMLYNSLTVAENLRFYARMYNIASPDGRTQELIELFGLTLWQKTRVGDTSRGIQQRTAIARALIHEPSVLLLDEPESGLDPTASDLLQNILKEHTNSGGAVISTTHNLEFASSTSGRIVILTGGNFIFQSTPETAGAGSLKKIFEQYSETGL